MKLDLLNRFHVWQLLAVACVTPVVHAATATKAATGTDLTLAASWSGGSGPGFPTSADVATWTTTSLGPGLTLGSNVTWDSINVGGATGAIAITGGGKITTGNITLAGNQTLAIANGMELGSDSVFSVANINGTSAADATLSGEISGGFGITKSSGGTLTLSGSSTYNGVTAVNAGTLNIASTGSLVSSISVGSGATLAGSGITSGNITFNAGSNIIATSSLPIQGLDVAVNATTNIFVTGTPTGAPSSVNVVEHTGTLTGLGNFTPAANYRAGSITDTDGIVSLTYTGEPKAWNDAAGTWEVGTASQWTGGSDTSFHWGDSTAFGAITEDRIVTLNGKLAPTSVAVTNAANTYTFSGPGEITGPCPLSKSGAGTLTIATPNSYTGPTTVSAGLLNVSGSGTLGAGNGGLAMSGGVLDLGGTTQTVGPVSVSAAGTIQNGSLSGTSYAVSNTSGTTAISASLLASGAAGLSKSGPGTLVLSGANTYTGPTTIGSGGSVSLSGGDNRLATTGTVNFTGTNSLNIGSTQQSLDRITITGGAINATVAGSSGSKLTLTGATLNVGSATGNSLQQLLMGGTTQVSDFVYDNSAGTVNVTTTFATASAASSVITLGTTNVITASEINIARFSTSGANNSGSNINMGQTNTLNADTITLGSGTRVAGTLQYSSANVLTSPSLTIRATDGTSRANMLLGSQAGTTAGTTPLAGTVNLTSFISGTSTVDALLGTLTIGQNTLDLSAGASTSNCNGVFTMGGGTVDATTILLGQDTDGFDSTNASNSVTNATFTTGPGLVKVNTLTMGDKRDTDAKMTLNSIFNLNGGGILQAGSIAAGTGTGNAAFVTRNLNWNDGTIKTYDAATDLTIGSGITVNLAATGTHTFDVGTSRTITVPAVLANTTRDGALVKSGNGTLILNAANTHSGNTTIGGGALQIGDATALGFGGRQTTTGSTTVGNGFTLDLNGSATVNEPLVLNGTGIGGNGALVNGNASTTATLGTGIAGLSLPGATAGSLYSSVPTVTISGTGSGATAIASLGLTTASMTPTFPGGTAGWVVGNTLSVTGGGGSGAIATVTSVDGSGKVTGLSITTPGVGYTTAPTALARLTGVGTGTVAIAGNAANFTVSSLAMTNPGSGYSGTPTYAFDSGNAPAGDVNLSSVALASDSSIGGAGNLTVNAVVSESGGARALTKVGSGTLVLGGANTYAGTTTVTSGTLLANNPTGSATGSGDVTVKTTATFGGTGAVSGAVIVEAGGTLAPGASVGTLATGAFTLPAGSTLAAEVNSATATLDRVTVTGALALGGNLSVTDIAGLPAALTPGTKLTLITYSGALTGTFSGKPEASTFTVGGNTFKIRYADSGAVTLEAMAAGTGYAAWASLAGVGAADDDDDNDGLANGVEYVLGTHPASSNAGGLDTTVTGGNVVFTFTRSDASETPDTAVSIEVGTTLAAWPSVFDVGANTAGSDPGVTVTENPAAPAADPGTDLITVTIPVGANPEMFGRLRVTVTP